MRERIRTSLDEARLDAWKIALEIDDCIEFALRVYRSDRFENAVGAACMIRPRHQSVTSGSFDGVNDIPRLCSNEDRADISFDRSAPHVHDHRQACDYQEWFSR